MHITLEWQLSDRPHLQTISGTDVVRIGRTDDCNVVIADASVGLAAALISARGGDIRLHNASHHTPLTCPGHGELAPGADTSLSVGDTFCVGQVAVRVLALQRTHGHTRRTVCTNCEQVVIGPPSECPWCGVALTTAQGQSIVLDE